MLFKAARTTIIGFEGWKKYIAIRQAWISFYVYEKK